MRAESERAFQDGGLAAATQGPPEEDELAGAIVERATHPGAGQSLSSMIIKTKQDAIDRLRQTRTGIGERRERQQKEDSRNKWLALAQGMLAPTRTGSFGESLGTSAGLLRQESELRAQHEAEFDRQLDDNAAAEIAAESDAVDQMLKMSGYANSNRAKSLHGAIQTMVAPEDKNKPIAQQRLIFGAVSEGPDGQPVMTPLKDNGGDYWIAADRLEPARAAALMTAAETAQSQTGRSEGFIAEAYGVKAPLANVRRANEIFENAETIIETSGINAFKNRVANLLGVDFGDTVELTELQMIVAEDYLAKLAQLKGSTSDRDVMEMKGISVGLGQNATANYRALKRMEGIYTTSMRRGIREAYQSGDRDAVADLWEGVEGRTFDRTADFISTQKEFDDLKPGTYYYVKDDWGGARRRKPLAEEE